MSESKSHNIFLLAGLLLIVVSSLGAQENLSTHLSHWATDLTGTLSAPELQQLDDKLREFERATSTQIVVMMIPTLNGRPIEEAALEVAEANRLGRQGRDNGALLFIAKDDRKIRIEVGYGLEGVLTDALSGQIIRKEITPSFRRGDYYSGINAGIAAIMLATKNEYTDGQAGSDSPTGVPFLLLLFFLLFFGMGIFRRRMRGVMGAAGPLMYSGWGRGSGWGGSGWGGGGGFSGGGGSFGGGGASGSW
jgi:uncharacterized protein